jgi:hypothetical protein
MRWSLVYSEKKETFCITTLWNVAEFLLPKGSFTKLQPPRLAAKARVAKRIFQGHLWKRTIKAVTWQIVQNWVAKKWIFRSTYGECATGSCQFQRIVHCHFSKRCSILKSVANLSWLMVEAPFKKMLVVDQIVRVKRDQKMSQNG